MSDILIQKILNSSPKQTYQYFDELGYYDENLLKEYTNLLNEIIFAGHYHKMIKYLNFIEKKGFTNDKYIRLHLVMHIRCYLSLGKYDALDEVCINHILRYNDLNILLTAYSGKAIAEKKHGNYANAFEYYATIIEKIKNAGNEKQHLVHLNMAYMNIAVLYHNVKEFKKALKNYDIAIKFLENTDAKISLPINYLNKADTLFELSVKNVDQAIALIDKTFDIYASGEIPKDIYIIKSAKLTKSKFLLRKGKNKEAFAILSEFDDIEEISEIPIKIKLVHRYLCYYYAEKKHEDFKNVFEKNKAVLCQDDGYDFLDHAYQMALKIYEKFDNPELFIKTLKEFNIFQLAIRSQNKISDMNISSNRQKIIAKEKEISFLKKLQEVKDKNNEKLKLKNKELENFATIAAHDIKAPLRNINSFINILKRRLELDENNKEIFTLVENSAQQMTTLVQDLLKYAKSGSFEKAESYVNLNNTIHKVKNNLSEIIKEKKVSINVVNELPSLKVHDSQMLQLFQNLISNSIKFSKESEIPKIIISYKKDEDKHIITLNDNGIGIPKDQQTRIFQPLVKLHAPSEYEGSGLGLSTCLKIVNAYGGTLNVESEEGKGTTFIILFLAS